MSRYLVKLWAFVFLLPAQPLRAQHPDVSLDAIIAAGQRVYNWAHQINTKRPQNNLFFFENPIQKWPVERPMKFSESSALADFDKWLRMAPQTMVRQIVATESLPPTMPVAEAAFRKWGNTLIDIYDVAVRLRVYEAAGYLGSRREDVRGYYVLSREPRLKDKLTNWPVHQNPRDSRLKDALVGLCYLQVGDDQACAKALEQAIVDRTVFSYYTQYKSTGDSVWQAFFHCTLPMERVDLSASNAHVLTLLFQPPEDTLTARVFREQIERTWRTNDWQLKIRYSEQAVARLMFHPNVTSHVQGNTLIMNANQDLREPRVALAFQHELGHILGFRDCYVHFYDPMEKVFVKYQLDTTNIMCNIAGRVLPQHVAQLKRAYLSVPDVKAPERGTATP